MSGVDYPIPWTTAPPAEPQLSIFPRSVPYRAAAIFVALAEILIVLIGSGFGPIVYGEIRGEHWAAHDPLASVGILASVCYATIACTWRLYALPTLLHPLHHLRRIAVAACLALLMLTAILFLLKVGSSYSRGAVLIFAGFMLACCCFFRLLMSYPLAALLRRHRLGGRPVALIGERDQLAGVHSRAMLIDFGLEERARILVTATQDEALVAEDLRTAISTARDANACELLLALTVPDTQRLAVIMRELRASPLPVRLLHRHALRAMLSRQAGMPDPRYELIDLQRAPFSRVELAIKRLIDVVGASLGLVLLAPLLLAAAIAVWVDSDGPILFRQKRNGFNQRCFRICKFRTMTVVESDGPIRQASRNDHRVTRVGRVLRRTSIDELPQLWNVLTGDMSLVGPRPHALAHDDLYAQLIGDYSLRHRVKPGITGWAQINGHRGETIHNAQMAARVELDLWYINNWSIVLDCQILLRTMLEVFRHDAY